MVWGVRYLQEGMESTMAPAVMRSATVPFGWIIGCPLFGSFRIELADVETGNHGRCDSAYSSVWPGYSLDQQTSFRLTCLAFLRESHREQRCCPTP